MRVFDRKVPTLVPCVPHGVVLCVNAHQILHILQAFISILFGRFVLLCQFVVDCIYLVVSGLATALRVGIFVGHGDVVVCGHYMEKFARFAFDRKIYEFIYTHYAPSNFVRYCPRIA